jgi:hypothetical protein
MCSYKDAFSSCSHPAACIAADLYSVTTGDPGSAFSIKFPEVLGGEYLRNGLRTIARSYLDFHAFPAD